MEQNILKSNSNLERKVNKLKSIIVKTEPKASIKRKNIIDILKDENIDSTYKGKTNSYLEIESLYEPFRFLNIFRYSLSMYNIKEEEFLKLIFYFEKESISQGNTIYSKGDIIESWYFLTKGRVSFYIESEDNNDDKDKDYINISGKNMIKVGESIPETFFGEKEFILSHKSTCTAIADCDTEVIKLNRNILKGRLTNYITHHFNSIQRTLQSIFTDLDSEFIRKLASNLHLKYYKLNDVVFKEGQHADKFYILYYGEVDLVKRIKNTEKVICNMKGKGILTGFEALYSLIDKYKDLSQYYEHSLVCRSVLVAVYEIKFDLYFKASKKNLNAVSQILHNSKYLHEITTTINNNIIENNNKNTILFNEKRRNLLMKDKYKYDIEQDKLNDELLNTIKSENSISLIRKKLKNDKIVITSEKTNKINIDERISDKEPKSSNFKSIDLNSIQNTTTEFKNITKHRQGSMFLTGIDELNASKEHYYNKNNYRSNKSTMKILKIEDNLNNSKLNVNDLIKTTKSNLTTSQIFSNNKISECLFNKTSQSQRNPYPTNKSIGYCLERWNNKNILGFDTGKLTFPMINK